MELLDQREKQEMSDRKELMVPQDVLDAPDMLAFPESLDPWDQNQKKVLVVNLVFLEIPVSLVPLEKEEHLDNQENQE